MRVWRLSVAYIGPKSRTEKTKIRKTKIGTEVAHVTPDSDTTFKVKMSMVNLHGAGAYCGGLSHSLGRPYADWLWYECMLWLDIAIGVVSIAKRSVERRRSVVAEIIALHIANVHMNL